MYLFKIQVGINPDIVFIVPYRNRETHRFAFTSIMRTIVEDLNCKIIFAHQKDNRSFNRGAMKNAGLVYIGDEPAKMVEVGDVVVIPAGVKQKIYNSGACDLVFLAICSPRFTTDCYEDCDI